MDTDKSSEADSTAPNAVFVFVIAFAVAIAVYCSQGIWINGRGHSTVRQRQFDEEKRQARLRQQGEHARATAEYKEKHPAGSTAATDPKKTAPSKPKPRPPRDMDSGYNPLLGHGGGSSYRPSGFAKRGRRGG